MASVLALSLYQFLPLSYHLHSNCYKLQCVAFISCGPTGILDFGLMSSMILHLNHMVDADGHRHMVTVK